MATRTALLSFGGPLTTAETVIYTSPADTTTLVKYMTLDNSSAGSVTVLVRAPTLAGRPIRRNWILPTNTSDDWDCWFVLRPGDIVALTASVTGAIGWTMHGAKLPGVASP